MPKPDQFDDPNATCSNICTFIYFNPDIANELKKIGVPFEFGPTKLKQGYGEAAIYVLQSLVDLAFAHLKINLQPPVHRLDE